MTWDWIPQAVTIPTSPEVIEDWRRRTQTIEALAKKDPIAAILFLLGFEDGEEEEPE